MTALLDLPEIRERISTLSVAEYHQLGEFNENGRRTELIRGIIIEKMSESPLHRYLVDVLRRVLESQISSGVIVFSQDPMSTMDSEPEPDVMVVRDAPQDFRTAHPITAELVVEVAVSSLEIDRVKALIFAQADVKEYWIVCPEEKRVEVFRQPREEGYAETVMHHAPAVLESSALPEVRVDFGVLFGGV